jgi:hypothetical protein
MEKEASMTIDDVREIALHLCERGVMPSGRTVVAYAHATHRQIARKTALAHLQALAAEGIVWQVAPAAPAPRTEEGAGMTTTLEAVEYEVRQDPSPQDQGRSMTTTLEPVAEGPIAAAEAALREAETSFQDARDALLHAKLQLLACQGLSVQGVLHGSLHPQDEIHAQAVEDVDAHKRDYDQSWQTREQARTALDQAVRVYRRQAAEAWVQRHRRELVANMHVWGEKLRTATSDYMHAEAKKNHSLLRFAYEQAVAQAPVDGVTL